MVPLALLVWLSVELTGYATLAHHFLDTSWSHLGNRGDSAQFSGCAPDHRGHLGIRPGLPVSGARAFDR